MNWIVESICTGVAKPLGIRKRSAIAKSALVGPVHFRKLRVGDDEQVNRAHHGGPDMAGHLYPQEHCDWWVARTGDAAMAHPGAFGSNLVVRGLLESDVALGDRFSLGSAILEACQPRQPCATIEAQFERRGMVKEILESGRCGWFFRVIEEGEAQAGDPLVRVQPGNTEWTMASMFAVLWGRKAKTSATGRRELSYELLLPDKLRGKIS